MYSPKLPYQVNVQVCTVLNSLIKSMYMYICTVLNSLIRSMYRYVQSQTLLSSQCTAMNSHKFPYQVYICIDMYSRKLSYQVYVQVYSPKLPYQVNVHTKTPLSSLHKGIYSTAINALHQVYLQVWTYMHKLSYQVYVQICTKTPLSSLSTYKISLITSMHIVQVCDSFINVG